MGMITLAEYNRRWDMIMQAYQANILTKFEAIDAVKELTSQRIDHHVTNCRK
jgi:hypothetical protein